ncbi:MAG: type II secretion system protein [bacterium]|nr:type II secretion system protein [bacterium]
MAQYKYHKNNLGFSMIEIIVVIFILGLIGTSVWTFQSDIFSLNNILSGNITSQEEARNSFKAMTAGIRSISPSSLGAYPLYEVNPNSFTFYSDIDDDGLKERIRYFLSGNILKKGVLKPSGNPLVYNTANEVISEIIHNISNGSTPIFDYYDTDYDGTTAPLSQPVNIIAVRLVKITVIVNSNSSNPPILITFTTQVSMRNLKDNL